MFKDLIETLSKCISEKNVKTSGVAFKLLTNITVNILICCSLLITLKQFFGDPIECAVEDSKYKQAIQTKCWIEGVFIDKRLLDGEVGKTITRWGVGSRNLKNKYKYVESDFIHQNYYQWVAPVLLLQAFILYMPRAIWRVWENGLMGKLLDNTDSPITTEDWKDKKKHILRFIREISKRQHNIYVIKYIVCEVFACLALILNFAIMQWVFNGFWVEYRPAMSALFSNDLIAFSQYSARLFPTQAKCFFYKFGHSGDVQEWDSLCFLPQNVINEKIFVFLYVWFIVLLVLVVINMFGIFMLIGIKWLRTRDLRRMADSYFSRRFQGFFLHYSDYGYWFTLHLMHKNLSPVLFKDLLGDLMKGSEWHKSKDEEAKVSDIKYHLNQSKNLTLSNSTSEEI